MIAVKNLSYSYGREAIFKEVDFFVGRGEKIGIVGPNGSGKSTLFRLLTEEIYPDEGNIELLGNIMMVPQEVKRDEIMESSITIRDYVDANEQNEPYEILRILAKLELGQFGLDFAPQSLSGGQKTKLAIARALIAEPEILILDEPTNFLDIEGKKWVMNFLGRYPKTLLIVSHDLELLDKNIDKILNVNISSKKIEEYSGNYSSFVKLKGEQDALLVRKIAVQEKHIARMKAGWLKMSHVKSGKGVRQKLQLEKRIEQMENSLPQMPPEAKKIRLQLPEPAWVGSMPILAEHLYKSFGNKKVLIDVNFDIKRGERIALLGPNGAGKSTLIKIIMGIVKPDDGEMVLDEKIKIGYYSQEFESFNLNMTIMELMKEKTNIGEGAIRSMMGKFLFSGERVFQKIGTLSGGEKTRLAIAQLLLQNFNLLILDEPTTYLDVLSQRLILEGLKEYKGAMIIVSHTKEFIDELKPERKFLLPENKMILC